MARRRHRLTRREFGCALVASVLTVSPRARAFGEAGAFNPRLLVTGTRDLERRRKTAPGRWSLEVVGRTSAPARLTPTVVRADAPELLAEPFAVWAGGKAPEPLSSREIKGLRRFLALGGILFVDEFEPSDGSFLSGAKEQLVRVLPDASPIAIGDDNVVFRSFYMLRAAAGRVQKETKLQAIVRGGVTQVIFSPNDLMGALARDAGGVHPFEATPGGDAQREQAIRLAVNIAMYVLCSNYKDDQVHAPFLMRRRGSESP